jgi:hypothetical protein
MLMNNKFSGKTIACYVKNFRPTLKKYMPLIINVILSIITLIGIIVHIKMYTMNRSLHLDEAAFAESIFTRNFFTLVSAPLLNDQTAPVLYLYVVKIITLVFGHTETALRIFSFITFGGVLFITGILLKKAYRVNTVFVLLGICIISTLGIYMRYSNEFKPYMSDSFFVLTVLFVYYLYYTGKLKLPAVTSLYCVILLFSSPALFFVASVFIVEFITAVIKKDMKHAGRVVLAGIVVLVCFGVYYVWWLMPVAESGYMIDFWENHRFYLVALKKEHVLSNILNIARLFRPFGVLFFAYPVLFLAGFIGSVTKKNRLSYVVGLAACLLLVASSIEKYPMEPRLYMFVYALIVLYSAVCIDHISTYCFGGKIPAQCIAAVLSAVLLLNNAGFTGYGVDKLYVDTHEVNYLIEYVRNHIKDGEYLYSSSNANYVLQFKNGYATNKIGNVSQDNILYGGSGDDFRNLVNAKKAYLLFQRKPSESFLEQLTTVGALHEVGSYYKTPLYNFSTEATDPKLHETFESRDYREDITIIFRIAVKNIIEIIVKNDDMVRLYINTYKNGQTISRKYSIKHP